MTLTAENTAIVLDSTADFPDAQKRFRNWRVVPLYVNFGTESFRDGVDLTASEFYERLRTAPELPTTGGPLPEPRLEKFDDMQQLILLDPVHEIDETAGWPRMRAEDTPEA